MASEIQSQVDPKDPRRTFGNRGEELAVAFFEARGFRTVQRNWSCRVGEIDLICEKNGVTHFVEVKTRQSLEFGYPEEAITKSKLAHFRRAIESYLLSMANPPSNYQADALAILIKPGLDPEYHYVENVWM